MRAVGLYDWSQMPSRFSEHLVLLRTPQVLTMKRKNALQERSL